ncbi:putative Dol-P-Glc:Glc(2)Man(9)GlcNAc(2)-PP-Dol alpha-1,2-glucosyltransferase [Ornithodoros turicata]|uniref:putative Dol-P-Glc:Glc(2)Man(9)GlcNAc(2)-PP-Dol alpha-1,2-glucosyltransferase n=1 Tax=Ornithodoros turicata TaxID=34597 RepID=UPI0031396043
MHFYVFVLVFFIVATVTSVLHVIVNKVQETAYMDEEFHIPQAQAYCEHNFTHWDSKITTPPGLYLTSLALNGVRNIFTSSNLCTAEGLRFTNVFLTVLNLWLSSLISIKLAYVYATVKVRVKLICSSAVLTTLPVLYFFAFLYYTDPGTVFFLQLMYLYHLYEWYWLASAFGAASVMFRQTSIVWVAMLAGCRLLEIVEKECFQDVKPCEVIKAVVTKWIVTIKKIFRDCFGYMVVGVLFLSFIFYNGSIVLGDKSAHQACFHLAQLGYFLLFTLVHASPYLLHPSAVKDFCKSVVQHIWFYVLLAALSIAGVQKLSYVHPYLLADNRHFTFYLWRRFLGRGTALRCSLVPFYIYAGYAILWQLRHKSTSWRVLYCFAVLASTVPQKLLEFRYFIVPYLFFRLNIRCPSYKQLLLELGIYTVINVAAFYLFLGRTFYWEDVSSPQRFMW